MSRITDAMDAYFKRLTDLWQKDGTNPMTPWDKTYDQSLFVSGPDEDGYAEWKTAESPIPSGLPEMNEELRELFGRCRFWRMAGEADGAEFTFPSIPTDAESESTARSAIIDGEYYLGQGYVRLAVVSQAGNDDLLLIYNQKDRKMLILDIDRQITRPVQGTLSELIERMEVLK